MLFGLTNAPATFQQQMECVLTGLSGEECLIYLDDVIVFSVSFKEHMDWLTKVFAALEKAKLKLKLSKRHCPEGSQVFGPHCFQKKYCSRPQQN